MRTKLIFLLLITMHTYSMQDYYIASKHKDFTIFNAINNAKKPKKIFSFLALRDDRSNQNKVFHDALRCDNNGSNNAMLNEYHEFRNNLALQKPEQFNAICHSRFLQELSKVLKRRIKNSRKELPPALKALSDPNVYIIEYLSKLEKAKMNTTSDAVANENALIQLIISDKFWTFDF